MPVKHPGKLIKSELIEETGLTVTEIAIWYKYQGRLFQTLWMKKRM